MEAFLAVAMRRQVCLFRRLARTAAALLTTGKPRVVEKRRRPSARARRLWV